MHTHKPRFPHAPVSLLLGVCCFFWIPTAVSGERSPQTDSARPSADAASDPFAELLKNNSADVVKTGPSCQFIKIQLPPGVRPEDIPGFENQ